jgi:uncharacterized membrane protein SpoIIM required for sporulation
MLGAAAAGWVAVYADHTLARLLLPAQFRDISPSRLAQTKKVNAAGAALYPVIGSYIGVNNIQVAIMAFAGGVTFGALTVYAMIQNGLMVGVLSGFFGQAGAGFPFWALIAPHGSLELPAIIIAGGAGLKMAGSLLFPGDLTRGASLKAAAPVAARILLGTVPLFVLAAAIEGFFTPSAAPDVVKVAVGVVLFALLVAYVTLPGRNGDAEAGSEISIFRSSEKMSIRRKS